MNNIKKLAFLLVVSALSTVANAQLKIAHVNFNEIFPLMREDSIATMRTDSLQNMYKKEIESIRTELARMEADITALPANTPDIIKESKYKAYQAAQQNAQDFVQRAQEDIQIQDAKFKEPVTAKLKATISAVAKEKGYVYVFDDQALLVKPDSDDITDAVKIKLGILVTPVKK